MKKKNEICTLEFSMSVGECEDFIYEEMSNYGDREDKTHLVKFDDVRDYLLSLEKQVEKFFIGEHRTYGNIYYYDDNTMDILFNDCYEPDWSKQKSYKINGVPSILPNFVLEEN